MSTSLAAVLVLALSPSLAAAGDREKSIGNWKVVSIMPEDIGTKEQRNIYGKEATGFTIASREGRLVATITDGCRKPARKNEEGAAARNTIFAFAEKHRLDGDKLSTKVSSSWFHGATGSSQTWFDEFEGDKLHSASTPREEISWFQALLFCLMKSLPCALS